MIDRSPWEATEAEKDVALAALGGGIVTFDERASVVLRSVGPMISARALREAADEFAGFAALMFLVADRNLIKDLEGRLRNRAAALEVSRESP